MYQLDVYTTNTAIAGICGLSIPCGFANEDGESLPIGLQLQCQGFDELTMLRIARQFETATEFAAAPDFLRIKTFAVRWTTRNRKRGRW